MYTRGSDFDSPRFDHDSMLHGKAATEFRVLAIIYFHTKTTQVNGGSPATVVCDGAGTAAVAPGSCPEFAAALKYDILSIF